MDLGAINQLQRLQDWYLNQCDGDWEHDYGIKIETLDNPGWMVVVDLTGTACADLSVDQQLLQRSETDWISTEITERKFVGAGGSHNLIEILDRFFSLIGQGETAQT